MLMIVFYYLMMKIYLILMLKQQVFQIKINGKMQWSKNISL